jgi:hypothetical protein
LEWRQEKERRSDELLPVTTNTIEQQMATQNLQEKLHHLIHCHRQKLS